MTVKKSEHHLLLVWLILAGLVGFAVFVALREHVLLALYQGDSSKLSWAITLLFVIITIYCARRVVFVSAEINASRRVRVLALQHDPTDLTIRDGKIYLGDKNRLPDCLLTGYLLDLFCRTASDASPKAPRAPVERPATSGNHELIEVFEARLKKPHDLGWFFADIMIKLGLLGTIVGFVLMLDSVVGVTDFDVNTMQNILRQMSSGMGTALYTTFAGLVCSIITAVQFHLLDRAADELVDTTKHLTQVHLRPAL